MLLPSIQKVEQNGIIIEHEGTKFRIITEGVKLKKVRKLQKLMKKHKNEPEELISELEEIGIRVEKVREDKKETSGNKDSEDKLEENNKTEDAIENETKEKAEEVSN